MMPTLASRAAIFVSRPSFNDNASKDSAGMAVCIWCSLIDEVLARVRADELVLRLYFAAACEATPARPVADQRCGNPLRRARLLRNPLTTCFAANSASAATGRR